MSTDPHAATQAADESPQGRPPLLGDRYELQALLGAGGMGNVYRARDRELDELVALKVLRPEIARAAGALDRFRRELKLARRVTHPNVARVFDLGEHGGDRILTMELVAGESLAALLERERRLPTARALAIASSVCAGVAAAHRAGVIHRDLKPDNVLLGTEGRVVVTDFGIARALERDEVALTGAGFVGTPAYIAPEQVETPLSVDHRVDVYAFGEILYEMLTGERAWHGDTIFAIVARRLSSPPPDARARRPDCDATLAAIALRCMALRPDDRYATMDDVATALARVVEPKTTAPAQRAPSPIMPTERAPGLKRVAVLPFRNGGPASDAHLADGLTEDLIDLLTAAKGLRVTSRGVVMRHRETDLDPRALGRELDVQVVVEGSVRRGPGSIRINARLVSVDDGFQLWARRFDGVEADVFRLNENVATAVAEALTVDIVEHSRGAVEDPEALDLYLRARSALLGYYGEEREKALELFERARARSPNDPRVLAGYVTAFAATTSEPERLAELGRLAEHALALAPSLPDAHVALGALAFHENDAARAVTRLVRALRLAPNHADAHDLVGRILLELDAPEGVAHVEAAIALEPGSGLPRGALARHYMIHGDPERGEAILEGAQGQADFRGIETRTIMWSKDAARARELLARYPEGATGVDGDIRLLLQVVSNGIDPPVSSFVVLGRGSTRFRSFFSQMQVEIACTLGQLERACDALATADAQGLIDLAWIDRCPAIDPIRDRPAYARARESIARRAAAARAAYAEGRAATSR